MAVELGHDPVAAGGGRERTRLATLVVGILLGPEMHHRRLLGGSGDLLTVEGVSAEAPLGSVEHGDVVEPVAQQLVAGGIAHDQLVVEGLGCARDFDSWPPCAGRSRRPAAPA